jgi:hypothetical protein
MTTQIEILTEDEKKVRSDWRQSFFVYLIGSLVITFAIWLLFTKNIEFFWIAHYGSFFSINLAIVYYCAYVKSGTKYLGLYIAIGLAGTIFDSIMNAANIMGARFDNDYYFAVSSIFTSILFVYFWIHCKRLSKLNKSLKKQKITACVVELVVVK